MSTHDQETRELVIRLGGRVDQLSATQKTEAEKHEDYREAVHNRMNKINNDINIMRMESTAKDQQLERRIDNVEYHQESTKEFMTEVKKALNSLVAYVETQKAKSGIKQLIIKGVFQFVGLFLTICATLVAVMTYMDSLK